MRSISRGALLVVLFGAAACRSASPITAQYPLASATPPVAAQGSSDPETSANIPGGRTFDDMIGPAVVPGDALGVAFSGDTSLEGYVIDGWCPSGLEPGWFGEREWESPIAPTFVCP